MREEMPCFECGIPTSNRHHVVPVSKGGKNTVPLCPQCHRNAHGDPGKRKYNSQLIKDGIAKARRCGVPLGAPRKKTEPLLPLHRAGMSYRQIGKRCGISIGTVHYKLKQEFAALMSFNKPVK